MAPNRPAEEDRGASPQRIVAATVAVLILLAAAWFLSNLLLQVFAAILLAIALQAGAGGLQRLTGLGRRAGVLVVLLVFLAVAVTALRMAGPAVLDQFERLVRGLPRSWQAISDWLSAHPVGQAIVTRLPGTSGEGGDGGADGVAQMAERLPDAFGFLAGTLNSLIGSLTALFLLTALSVYFAMEGGLYRRGALRIFAPAHRDRAGAVLDEMHHRLAHWMGGQAVDMLFVGILAGLGLWALGVPLALILAVIAGLTNIVPIVGPFVSGAIAVATAAPEGLDTALYVALLFTGIQMVEGNVMMPLIQRYAVDVPPALTLIAIVAVASLFNPLAVVLATPLLIVAMTLIQRVYIEGILGDRDGNPGGHGARMQGFRDSDT